jgi:hypothetical protein
VSSPIVDLGSTAWPPRFGDMSWRYGFLGLAAGYVHTPLMGVVLAMSVAYWRGHSGMLRALGIASLVAALILLPVLALWPMDVLQMRALREPEVQRGILIGGVIQEIKYMGAFIVLGCLGLGSMGTSAQMDGAGGESPGVLRRG